MDVSTQKTKGNLMHHVLRAWCSFPLCFWGGYLHQHKKYYNDSLKKTQFLTCQSRQKYYNKPVVLLWHHKDSNRLHLKLTYSDSEVIPIKDVLANHKKSQIYPISWLFDHNLMIL